VKAGSCADKETREFVESREAEQIKMEQKE
jgi:hypothetical protein